MAPQDRYDLHYQFLRWKVIDITQLITLNYATQFIMMRTKVVAKKNRMAWQLVAYAVHTILVGNANSSLAYNAVSRWHHMTSSFNFFFAPVCCTGDNIQDVHLIASFTISFLLLLDAACCSKTMVPGTLTGCGAKRQVFWNYRKQYSRALLVNFPASHKKGTIWET